MFQSACVLLVTISSFHVGMPEDTTSWLTGRLLDRKTQHGISGQWADVPIRQLLNQLSRLQKIAVFVDRRVDQSSSVTVTANELTWEQLLMAIAEGDGDRYAFCRVENIYYFGPAEVALALPTHYGRLNSWIRKNRKDAVVNWRRRIEVKWDKLSQPRKLLMKVAETNKIEAISLDDIPFDLWPKFESSPQPLALNAVLLAIGFNKWIAVSKSGQKLKIVPFPKLTVVDFSVGYIADVKRAADSLEIKFPGLTIRVIGKKKLVFSGRLDDVRNAVREAIACQESKKGKAGISTFTAELKGERGSILATMAEQLSVKLSFKPEIQSLLSEHLEIEVVDATANEIIELALKGTGLSYQVDATKLRISK